MNYFVLFRVPALFIVLLVSLFCHSLSVAAERATLGIMVRQVSNQYAHFIGLDAPRGAQVVSVQGGGSLQPGDLILMVNETPVQSPADLQKALRNAQPGEQALLQIVRGAERRQVAHTLKGIAAALGGDSWRQPIRREPPGLGSFQTVAGEQFEKEVLQSSQPVLVYFYANWCGPCKTYLPIMQQVEKQYPEVKIVGVDVDKNRELVNRYGISRILPALILFNGGKEVDKVMPVSNKELVDTLLGRLTSDKLELFASLGREGWIQDIAFIPGSTLIAARNADHTVLVWDYQKGLSHWIYRGYVTGLSPNGKYAAQSDLKLQNISLINNLSRQYQSISTDQYVEKLAVSPLGNVVACFGIDKNGRYGVTIWGSDNRLVKAIPVDLGNHPQVVQFAFSPDGATFALASINKLEFFDTSKWTLETLIQRKGTASLLQFASDSRAVLVLGGSDELIDLQGKRIPWKNGRTVQGKTEDRLFIATHGDNTFSLVDNRHSASAVRFVGHRAPINRGAVADSVPWLASGSSDGTVRLWDRTTGKEIAQFVGLYNGEWIVVTPEGYYNSSPRGHELLSVRKGGSVFGVDQFYDLFYRPDIVAAKLKGEDISGLITLTVDEALKDPPPSVQFNQQAWDKNAAQVPVCYQIRSNGGGIGEVRLFQNGKLIKSDGFYRESVASKTEQPLRLASLNSRTIQQQQRSLVVREKQQASAKVLHGKGDLFEECVSLEPVSGENEISLAAFNAANTVQSRMAATRFNSARPPAEPHLYILAIGIDRYRDSSINLKYAAKDANDFIRLLAAKSATVYKTANIHLTTLLNEQAGRQQVLAAIEQLAAQVKPGDSFVFFNASHGLLLQNQYYIVTSSFNGRLAGSESLISSNEIVEMSKKIKSLSQLFVFDTCHAGGMDTIVSGLYDARMSVLAKKMGLHVFASAGSLQTALDGYQGNGLYTYTLLQGMQNSGEVDREGNGMVTVKKLGRYSKEKTTDISTHLGHPQTPYIINFGNDSLLYRVQ